MHSLQRVSRTTRIKRMVGLKRKNLWSRLQSEYKLLACYIMFLLLILMFVTITGCDAGWKIAGWEVK